MAGRQCLEVSRLEVISFSEGLLLLRNSAVLTRDAQASEEAEPDATCLEFSRARSWQSFLSQANALGNELGSGVLCGRMQMKRCLLL